MQAEAFWDNLPQQWPPQGASQPAAHDLHLGLRLQQGQVGPAASAAACRATVYCARWCHGLLLRHALPTDLLCSLARTRTAAI